MPADDIRMCEWADSRNHAGENRNRGEIMKRRECASLIILALAAVPALVSCDRTGLCDRGGWDPA